MKKLEFEISENMLKEDPALTRTVKATRDALADSDARSMIPGEFEVHYLDHELIKKAFRENRMSYEHDAEDKINPLPAPTPNRSSF